MGMDILLMLYILCYLKVCLDGFWMGGRVYLGYL
jgi:hypothetical protein